MIFFFFFFFADPAEIKAFSIKPSTLTENHTFIINCTIIGNPQPDVTIGSNLTGKILFSGNISGTVTVISPPIGCEDTGPWMCIGSNYLNKGDKQTRSENVTVYCEYLLS